MKDSPSTGDGAAAVEAPELAELPIGDEAPAGEGEAGAEPGAAPPGVMPREAFREGFSMVFRFGGAVSGFETLRQAPDRPEAAPAADCLYDMALESPWLRWLIEPQALWLQRALILGAFAVPVGTGCMSELRERREAARASKARPVDEPAAAEHGAAD